MIRSNRNPDSLADAVMSGERAALARAITLVESTRSADKATAIAVMRRIAAQPREAIRLGITGVPGVGKSTFIEAFGTMLTGLRHKVAVLAVDPTSSRSGGSILGDKTRMPRLSLDPRAFVRPSPAGATLGGVAARTREAILLCEAAGFDFVLVETVGVGQSETAVADLVDCFLVLMLAGAGDELQGIKKGILEIADLLAVNKADGENASRAALAAAELRGALGLLTPSGRGPVPVRAVSGLTGDGLDGLLADVTDFCAEARSSGALARRRAQQAVRWFRTLVEEAATARLRTPEALRRLSDLDAEVAAGTCSPAAAAQRFADG